MSNYRLSQASHALDDGRSSQSVEADSLPPFSSSAVFDQQQQEQQPGHKRVYQACIPCRRRKVRCDLGSVDNPHDPPCVRCRRESKECYFSATRRKRKTDDGSIDGDDYLVRNGRRRLHSDESSTVAFNDEPLATGLPNVRSHPLRRPQPDDPPARSAHHASSLTAESVSVADEPNTPLENFEAQTVMRRQVYGPHDALDLLYKAATDSPHTKQEPANGRGAVSASSSVALQLGQNSVSGEMFGSGGGSLGSKHQPSRVATQKDPAIDPDLERPDPTDQPGYAEALKLWARFRFVRAGWFTAQEAIEYIDYYYKFLSPLTPISPPTFNNPASHVTLLNEEPILAVTLLTISSRYKALDGPGGMCRAHAIHEQLWTYLRGMIERVVWGQEAFGGGFCGSGSDEAQTSSTAPWRGLRKGSLRTLGTVESLMILTEWHPRALHFPPADVTDELLLPSYDSASPGDDGDGRPAGAVGGKRIDSWLEPAWRSDRMCWMLLSTAMGLAYELGVFDDIDDLLVAGSITRPEYEEETYRLRAYRIKRLLLIYLTQLAGRLGWTSMVPEGLRKRDPASSKKRPTSVEGQTPGTVLSSVSNAFNYIPDLELDDQIIHCWAGISNAMHIGNEKLFRSRQHTTEIIQSGKYTELLKDFQPLLRDWWKEFERFKLPTFIRHILSIEYEYIRIYINSLALQAVVERCTTNTSNNANGGSGGASGNAAPHQLSPQTQNYYGKLPLGRLGGLTAMDKAYVKEVVDGSRSLLTTVVDGLLPGGYLKHAPVRTYFRIISGAMFLLKTFAIGAPKADVEISIALMDRTVDALRNCVVDDVHLGIRFADLLESLTSRLRNRFIHAPSLPASVNQSADGRSPNPYTEGNPGVNGHAARHTHGQGGAAASPGSVANGEQHWPNQGPSAGLERSSTPANISATPFDPTPGSFHYLSGTASVLNPSTPAIVLGIDNQMDDAVFPDATDWNNNEMWYLPAGPAFFQNMGDSNVAMTAEGVSVAGMDLLDFMAMDGTGL